MHVIHVVNDNIFCLFFVVLDVTGLQDMIWVSWEPTVSVKSQLILSPVRGVVVVLLWTNVDDGCFWHVS